MATLTITPMEATGATLGVLVTATLTDADGVEVSGMLTADPGVIVRPTAERITAVPHTLDLTPNADISPANTYWTVEVAGNSFLITKTSASETLVECLAVDPVDLALPVMVQEVSAEVTTQVDALAATLPDLADSPAGTVPVPVGTTVLVVESGAIRQTDATEFGGTVDLVSNVATASILGRVTGGSGDSEELTGTQAWSILDDASPTSAMTWTASLTISAADGFSVGSGTAANGDVHLGAGALGSAASFFANTADTQAAAVLGSALGLRFGPGGSTIADWSIVYTTTAVATMTGELRTSTAPSTGNALANKTYVDAQVDDLSGVTNAATARTNLGATATGVSVFTAADQAALTALIAAASDTAAGIVELATDAETITGTATNRAVTPANLAATAVLYTSKAGRNWSMCPPVNKAWKLITPLSSSSLVSAGTGAAHATTGTITTVTPAAVGHSFSNVATAASAGANSDVRQTQNAWYRGASSDVYAGFGFHARVRFPDASYNETGASTGSRFHIGMSAISPPNIRRLASHTGALFNREHENGHNLDTNWQFITNDGGATGTTTDTGIPFTVGSVYDLWIWCAAGATSIGWTIDNLTAGTTATGSHTTDLPAAATALYPGMWGVTLDAVARSSQLARMFIEADKG